MSPRAGQMSPRERLTTIFRGGVPDRPAIKLWAAEPGQAFLHEDYRPVHELAMEKTDLFVGAGSPLDLHWGANPPPATTAQRATDEPEWVDVVTRIETPEGPLQSTYRRSTVGHPGYQMEYAVKEPGDLKKLLSVPFQPHPFQAESYFQADANLGDRGLVAFGLPHGAYGLHTLMGSETLAYWSLDAAIRAELLEIAGIYVDRVRAHVHAALAAGIRGVFAWVGPELFIPPLLSPKDFEDFVMALDQPLIDDIHAAGGLVWVHSHGDMKRMIARFAAMNIDVLNPLEPPPMGDLTLAEAFAIVGESMALEGGIESHDLMVGSEKRVRQLVREAMESGRGRRFILCPSSGYMEVPNPPATYIRNQLAYIDEAARCAQDMGAGR